MNPWFQIPSLKKFSLFILLFLALLIEFSLVYGFTNWMASQRTHLFPIYFEWETEIPFIPHMIYAYFSLNLLTLLTVFTLTEDELKRYARSMAWAIWIAGVIFLILPGKLGFQRPADVPGYENIFPWLYSLDRPHNLFPSLHITFSALSVLVMLSWKKSKAFSAFLILWFFLICLSVLLVHQHHFIDIVGGFVLAFVCYMKIYKRRKKKR